MINCLIEVSKQSAVSVIDASFNWMRQIHSLNHTERYTVHRWPTQEGQDSHSSH